MTDPVLISQDGPVLRIRFNRPERLNAVTTSVLRRAADAVAQADSAVRVVAITGAGKAFSAGADLLDHDGGPGSAGIDEANRLIRAIVDTPKPVVAAVPGAAAGVGCSIALACDLVWAAESAYFLLAFAGIGLMPDGGSTATVAAAVGRARAARMALLAERIPAHQAHDWGLISAVVPDDELTTAADQVVTTLAAGPTAGYAETKRALRAASLPDLDGALDRERDGQLRLFGTADFAEGVRAFQERRLPEFAGR